MVHGLIEKLINNDEIISYGLLLQNTEVILEHRRKLVEEGNDEGGIGIFACYRAEIQVVVFDVDIRFPTPP